MVVPELGVFPMCDPPVNSRSELPVDAVGVRKGWCELSDVGVGTRPELASVTPNGNWGFFRLWPVFDPTDPLRAFPFPFPFPATVALPDPGEGDARS